MNVFGNLTRRQLLEMFSMIVMSDGYIHSSQRGPSSIRLVTKSTSVEQHKLFRYLSLKLFDKEPKIYFNTSSTEYSKSSFIISELFHINAIRELTTLSKTFKTTPYRKTNEQFLSGTQPTISFLFKEPKEIKWLAISLWFDFDGSISSSFRLKNKKDKKNGKVYQYYQVQFECEIKISETNPNLVEEFLELFKYLELFAVKKKDKRNWSNLDGVCIHRLNDIRKFVKYARPLTNVKVSKGKIYNGISKKSIMKAVEEILNSETSLSKYFKDKEEALRYKNFLNSLLYRKIREYETAPSSRQV